MRRVRRIGEIREGKVRRREGKVRRREGKERRKKRGGGKKMGTRLI